MTSIVTGLFYGCEIPDGLDIYAEGGDGYTLVDRWAHADENTGAILAVEGTADGRLVGFWLAHPLAPDDSVIDTDRRSVALEDILAGQGYQAARREWRAFAAWMETRSIRLPWPRLWLAPVEVA